MASRCRARPTGVHVPQDPEAGRPDFGSVSRSLSRVRYPPTHPWYEAHRGRRSAARDFGPRDRTPRTVRAAAARFRWRYPGQTRARTTGGDCRDQACQPLKGTLARTFRSGRDRLELRSPWRGLPLRPYGPGLFSGRGRAPGGSARGLRAAGAAQGFRHRSVPGVRRPRARGGLGPAVWGRTVSC